MKGLALVFLGFTLLPATARSPLAGPSRVSAAPLAAARSTSAQDSDTETVLSTFRPRTGKEDELLKTMNQNWATLRRLGLVLQEPHLILRGKDDAGKTIFVEILTWRDHEAADHVPAEVQTIWNQLQSLVEERNGHKGIEFPEFEIVSASP
jgi:hypothetical protein